MMKIDIDRLTEDELVDLNHRIVARLKMLNEVRAHSQMLEFKIGDRVQAMATGGTFCEYSIAPAAKAFRIPDAMSFEEAAAMIVIYQTSYFALTHRTTIKPGEWLLVHAGAGA